MDRQERGTTQRSMKGPVCLFSCEHDTVTTTKKKGPRHLILFVTYHILIFQYS